MPLPSYKISQLAHLSDVVYSVLKKAIFSGNLYDREKINMEDLAKKMQISITPIREALRKLEFEEFVEFIPRKGVFVRGFKAEDIEEIYEIRETFEILAMKHLVPGIDKSDLLLLKECNELSKKYLIASDFNQLNNAYYKFNLTFAKATKLSRLSKLLVTYYKYIEGFRSVTFLDKERQNEAQLQHEMIVKAIEEGDLQKGILVIKEHIRSSLATFLKNRFTK